MNIFFLEGIIKILEERMAGIFVAEDAFGFGNLPVDAQGRIRQEDASVGFGMVEFVAFVGEDGLLAQHAEAVGKPLGDIELQVVVLVEFNGKMLSEGGAVFTQIYCHIEYASVGTTDEFGLTDYPERNGHRYRLHGIVLPDRSQQTTPARRGRVGAR